jgi:hypothetical protein
MPWNEPQTRAAKPHTRNMSSRYASDLTDAEWALVAPHLPPAKDLGPPAQD